MSHQRAAKYSLWFRTAYQVDKEDRDIRLWGWSRQVVRLDEASREGWSTSCGEVSVNRGVKLPGFWQRAGLADMDNDDRQVMQGSGR